MDTEVILGFNCEQTVIAIENAQEISYKKVDTIKKQLSAGEGVLYILSNDQLGEN